MKSPATPPSACVRAIFRCDQIAALARHRRQCEVAVLLLTAYCAGNGGSVPRLSIGDSSRCRPRCGGGRHRADPALGQDATCSQLLFGVLAAWPPPRIAREGGLGVILALRAWPTTRDSPWLRSRNSTRGLALHRSSRGLDCLAGSWRGGTTHAAERPLVIAGRPLIAGIFVDLARAGNRTSNFLGHALGFSSAIALGWILPDRRSPTIAWRLQIIAVRLRGIVGMPGCAFWL